MRHRGACAFAALALLCGAEAIWPFQPKRFRGNRLIEAGSLGLDTDGRVVAFGDFNGDQFLDILSLASDLRTLTVYHWNHENFQFDKSSTLTHPRRVYNVVPGDFNQDGTLDLLVMSESETSPDEMAIDLYVGSLRDGFNTPPKSAPASAHVQPIPVDTNGDMKLDLFGTVPAVGGSEPQFKVWQNVWNASRPHEPLFNLVDPNFAGAQCKLSDPHSNAVVDLNGDCLADLFLVCDDPLPGDKFFQIWVNQKSSGFSLAQTGRLPRGVQSISFADIDRDGTIDMVFPSCSSVSPTTGIGNDCYINIAYNQQLPLCTSTSSPLDGQQKRACRRLDELCEADPNFKFDLTDSPDNKDFVRFPVSALFPSAADGLLVLDTTTQPALPVPLKLGDADLDGFPDLLIIKAFADDLRSPRLLSSVPCAPGVVGCGDDGSGRRGWSVVETGVLALNFITDARGAAFLDMDEDGTLDLMIQRSGAQGLGSTLFVQNNFYYDAFFLKAIVLNDVCPNGWCMVPNSTEQFHPFGLSFPGATYKYTVLDTSGRRSAAQVGQLPQSAYHSLLTPYTFFGLGRTNNYIESLFVGSTKHIAEHYINMEGVIPNSKVVIVPPAQEGAWKKELFLRPGEWIPWVTVTAVVATAILAAIVGVLHLSEKREDELERRRAMHHINFDAL